MLNGEYEAAIPELLAAATHYKAAGQWEHYFSCLNHTAATYLQVGKTDEAKRVAKKALWESILRLGRDNEEAARASHKLAETYSRAGRHEDAMEYHSMGLQIRRSLYGDHHPGLADSYDWMGKAWMARQDYGQAQKQYERALQLRQRLLGAEHPDAAASLYLLGELKIGQGQLKEAQEFHQKALDIRRKRLGGQHPETGHSLSRLAYILYQGQGPAAAMEKYQQAAGIFIRNKTYARRAEGEALHWLAWSEFQRGEYARARGHARLAAIGLSSPAAQGGELEARNQYLLGKVLMAEGDFSAAALQFEALLKNTETALRAGCFHQLVEAYLQAGRPEAAIQSAKAYLSWVQPEKEQLPELEGDALLQLGKAHIAAGHQMEGLAALKAAAESGRANAWEAAFLAGRLLTEDGRPEEAIRELNGLAAELKEAAHPAARLFRLQALLTLGEAHSELAIQGRNALHHLEMALNAYQLCDELLFSMVHSPLARVWRASLGAASESLYPKAIQAAYALHQQNQGRSLIADAFFFSERQKLLSLQLDILQLPELAFAGVPDALRQQEMSLRRQAEVIYNALASDGLPADAAAPSPEKLAQAEEAFQAVLSRLREEAPAYYQLRYSGEVAGEADVRSLLAEEEAAFYAYFQAKDYLYIFYVEEKQLKLLRRPLQDGLASGLYAFREQLRQAPRPADSLSASAGHFQALAFSLHESLLPANRPPEGRGKLFLLPHGMLHFFPFEALVSHDEAEPNYSRLAYLGKEQEVLYYSSASQMAGRRPPARTGGYELKAAALIADYTQARAANEKEYARGANYSQAELRPMASFALLARTWCNRTGGTLLEGKQATKDAFYGLPSAEQLVLAAHAILSEEPRESFIALYGRRNESRDNLLTPQELFGTYKPTGASLIPSCLQMATAAEKGWPLFWEALKYSGTETLLFHRWENTGEPSARLAALFLEKSFQGQPPAEALRNARHQYLHSVEGGPAFAHPYYWAGYAFFDGRSIRQSSYGDSPYWILGAVGLLIIIGWWVKYR